MKTYKITFLIAMMLTGLPFWASSQGVNNGGFITGGTGSYISLNGSNFVIQSPNTGQFTIDNLVIEKDAALNENSFLTVTSSLIMNDTLTLKATSSGNASLITNGSVSGTGSVQQYLAADQWHMISSMVAGALSGVYTGAYLYDWNETDSTFSWISIVTHSLNTGEGYFAYSSTAISSPTTFTFDGTFNTGDVSPTLSYTSGLGKGDGWNLCGNPYPSSIRWDGTWTTANLDATVYVWDGAAGNYVNYNYNTGLGALTNGDIMPGQGFWVKANAASPSMTIPNSKRLHTTNSFLKAGANKKDVLEITINGKKGSDYCVMKFDAAGTSAFNPLYDAYKLDGRPEAPEIYFLKENQRTSSGYFPALTDDYTVRLGCYGGEGGETTITFSIPESFDNEEIMVYLLDNKTGIHTLLNKTPSYTFNADKNSFDEDRFKIVFTKTSLHTENLENRSNVKIYACGNDVYLTNGSATPLNVTFYLSTGQQLAKMKVEPYSSTIQKINLHNQPVIIRAFTEENVVTKKLFIR